VWWALRLGVALAASQAEDDHEVSGPPGADAFDTLDEYSAQAQAAYTSGDHASSSSSSDSDSSSVRSDDLEDLDVLEAHLEAHENSNGRVSRSDGWCTDLGVPFTIARIFRSGEHIGWGAVCALHKNRVHDRCTCKKTIALGKGVGQLTDEECVVRLKRWLIEGLLIDRVMPGGRHRHRDVDARRQ
jgi:hypothetical protein